jgi:alginate O-acetyltransferase complex protein AlgI
VHSYRSGATARILAIGVLGSTLFLAVNVMLFGTGVYRRMTAPASSSGSFERAAAALAAAPSDPRTDVLVLGDSRIYDALEPDIADRAAGSIRFFNAGLPGTSPRSWTFLDRAIDPTPSRFRAVVIPVDSYDDDTSALGSIDAEYHSYDLHAVVFHMRPTEIADLAGSLPEGRLRRNAALDLLLRGPLLRDDLVDALAAPLTRATEVARDDPEAYDPRRGHPVFRNLAGLRVDFRRRRIAYPAVMSPGQRAELPKRLFPGPSTSPTYARYRARWLGALVARYRAAHVPVLFVRIPARPVRGYPARPPNGTIARFARDDGVFLIPQAPYLALERPALFGDAEHLDEEGGRRFSAQLGRDVAAALAHPARGGEPIVANPTVARIDDAATLPFDLLAFGTPIRMQSLDFALFFLVVCALFYAAPRRFKPLVLLLASYYFYARWNRVYLAVLLLLTLGDYAIARAVGAAPPRRRRLLLALGIAANLAFLGTFKYANFVTGNVAALAGMHGNPWLLDVLVPVGISFHTFQSISYLVDVYRGTIAPVRKLRDYALYLAFFPQLLAGPIVRAARFFDELAAWRRPSADDVERGVREILLGLVKKTVVADRFAAVADDYFGAIAAHPGAPAAWCGVFAFTIQIYFDLSGYSDIAIGTARLLGFAFPPNFARPYLAASITEFWRRWHMTLSHWLRDYLYIPLGGNRGTRLATFRNVMITMLLGGLWHGASWTFLAWGAYHGALLCVERAAGIGNVDALRPPVRIARVCATFVLVMLGWILFRARTFGDARDVVVQLVTGGAGAWTIAPLDLVPLAIALAIGIARERGARWSWRTMPLGLQAASACTALLLLELASWPGDAQPFVYFKF